MAVHRIAHVLPVYVQNRIDTVYPPRIPLGPRSQILSYVRNWDRGPNPETVTGRENFFRGLPPLGKRSAAVK